jgi:hypothetical protein
VRTLTLPETLRERRGHDFFVLPDETPKTRETDGDGPLADKTIWAHFFGPAQDWWLAECDDDGYAFGYADLGFGEWGYFSLPEMEAVMVHGGLVIIERDCFWEPKPFGECR